MNDERYKLVFDLASMNVQLFDLVSDPGEENDIAQEAAPVRDRLQRILLEHVQSTEGSLSSKRAIRVSRRIEESLKQLGYLD